MEYVCNISRKFIEDNMMDIVCEPSGKGLFEIEAERKRPIYMKILDD